MGWASSAYYREGSLEIWSTRQMTAYWAYYREGSLEIKGALLNAGTSRLLP